MSSRSSGSNDDALQAAIKAAESSMQALKLTNDSVEKERISLQVKQHLQEAERIKKGTTVTQTRILNEPESTRKLPNQEQILLLRASYLNGFKFPPWTEAPRPQEFELNDGEDLFLYVSFHLTMIR